MKNITVSAIVMGLCLMNLNVLAAEKDSTKKETMIKDPMNWSASMVPEPTEEEKEEARWSIVVENEIGINAYDMESLRYRTDEKGNVDKNIMSILARTVYAPKDKKLAQRIEGMYKDKLKKKERVQSSNISMVFNMKEKTYYVESMDVYSNKKNLIEHKENPANFKAIPAGSIAEAMYEICLKAAQETEQAQEEQK